MDIMDMCNNIYYNQIINIIEKHKKLKSAEPTIKGFLYQFLVTLDKWIQMCNEKKFFEIYPENWDDIQIKLEHKTQYIQIKAYDSINFTLKNKNFLNSIKNFVELYIKNKMESNIEFIFHTNSNPGKKEDLMRRWIEGDLTNLEKKEIYLKISEDLNKAIAQSFKEDEKKDIIKQIIKDKWLDFIDLIKLVFEGITVDDGKERLENNILKNIKSMSSKYKNCESIFCRLLIEVIEKAIKEDSKDKKLDNDLMRGILSDSEDKIIMNLEKKLKCMETSINDNINAMSIKHSKEHREIKKELTEIRNKQNQNIEDMLDIIISSKQNIGQMAYTLNLTEFFKHEEGYGYKNIKNFNMWNNELLKKINDFFNSLIREQNYEKNTILFDGIHYSIAFYIGYKYGKALRNPYLKRNNEIYKFQPSDIDNNFKIYDDKILLEDAKDVVVIINTSRDSESIKNEVKDFINKNNIKKFNMLNLTLGENNDNCSVNKNNFYYIASKMSKLIQKYVNKNQTIHLFSVTTVEEFFAIGRLLFDMKNIVLYEHVGEEKVYIPTIRL